MRILCIPLLLAASLAAQGLTARVNDSLSHGMVGDGKLSLDEAIQLVNDTLKVTQLSPAEQAQISGVGLTVDTVIVDAAVVPLITYERDITPTFSVLHAHVDHEIIGIAGPNGPPVLDAGAFTAAFLVRTNHSHVLGFVLRHGKVGIDADSSGHLHLGDYMELGDLTLEGQSEAGLRLRVPSAPAGQQTPAEIHDITASNLPIGLDLQDQGMFGTFDLHIEGLHFENVKTGINLPVTGKGGTSSAIITRSDITGSDTGLLMTRGAGSDITWDLELLYAALSASHSAIDVQGSSAATAVHLHHSSLRGGPGTSDFALSVGPRNAVFDVEATEDWLQGNVAFAAASSSTRLWLENVILENGSLSLDNDGVAPEIRACRFASAPITVQASATTATKFVACEMVRSPISGLSSSGAITLQGCFVAASPTSGSVTSSSPASAPWIGRASVAPEDPPAGGYVDLQLDLQPDTAAAWIVGIAAAEPNTSNQPFRFYFDPSAYVVLPGIWILQQRVRLSIPPNASLAGMELYAQPVLFPTKAQSWVPPVTLPAGGRFVIQ